MPTGECDDHRDVIFCRLSSSSCDEDQMKRRGVIAGTAALLGSPRHVQAQGKPPRIGYFGGFEFPPTLRSGIGEKGWIEGKKLIVDYRYFEAMPSSYRLLRPNSSPSSPICSLAPARR